MKTIIRNTVINTFALFLLQDIVSGVHIRGGITTYLLGGFIYMLLQLFLVPILSIFTLPLRILTLGASSILINVIIVYILTVIVSDIQISAFVFSGVKTLGFIIPRANIN